MFTIRNFQSEETYDLAKFMNFEGDVFDVINCPFLLKLKELPTVKYYKVAENHRDIDMISQDEFDTPFFAFFIQYYNDTDKIVFDEEDVLRIFSKDDLVTLFHQLSIGSI